MNTNLIIRADANTRIGTGHIMRCIALAQAWQDQGGGVTFLSNCESEALRQHIIDEGFRFISIEKPHPDPYDLEHTINTLRQLETRNSKLKTWLVLDGYHFTPDYQKAVRENGYKLLVIDDMAHLDHYHADILHNQNIHASSLHYSCDEDTVKLLGCEYVLLRREFLKYKDWKREIPDKAKKILVTMGGSDPDNVTLKVIRALNSLNDPDLEVKIIAGPANPNIDSLEKELHLSPFVSYLLHNVSNMPELMTWADLAVTSGGTTVWELAYMGSPCVVGCTTQIEEYLEMGLLKVGLFKTVGRFTEQSVVSLSPILNILLNDSNERRRMMVLGRKMVDGEGYKRILNLTRN